MTTILSNTQYSEELLDEIEAVVDDLATFEAGDLVTVEPVDHDIAYAGEDMEGVPMTIDEPIVQFNSDVAFVRQTDPTVHPGNHEIDEASLIDTDDFDEEYIADIIEWLRVTNIRYCFEGSPKMEMSESALISWEQYQDEYQQNGEVNFLTDNRDEHHSVHRDEDTECPVCTAQWVETVQWDRPSGAGRQSCAVCGYTYSERF